MDNLAKWLFPNHPRMVRFRKLQVLMFAIAFVVAACVLVGLTLFLLNWRGK